MREAFLRLGRREAILARRKALQIHTLAALRIPVKTFMHSEGK